MAKLARIRISVLVESSKADKTLRRIRELLKADHIYLDTSAIDQSIS